MLVHNLGGKTAIITGSSRGIGAATALRLAREGADIAVNYINDEAGAQGTASKVRELGQKAVVVRADVSNPTQVQQMVQKVLEEFGHIDILVSNAGKGTKFNVGDTTDEEWERVFGINVKGLFHTARLIMPLMKSQKNGKIVAISSVVGKSGRGFSSSSATYAGAKAAIVGYVRGLAREGGPYGVNVNCIRPGWIDTFEHLRDLPDTLRNKALSEIVLGRTGLPEDIANSVAFLVSEDSAYMTGQVLDVNGGLFIG